MPVEVLTFNIDVPSVVLRGSGRERESMGFGNKGGQTAHMKSREVKGSERGGLRGVGEMIRLM